MAIIWEQASWPGSSGTAVDGVTATLGGVWASVYETAPVEQDGTGYIRQRGAATGLYSIDSPSTAAISGSYQIDATYKVLAGSAGQVGLVFASASGLSAYAFFRYNYAVGAWTYGNTFGGNTGTLKSSAATLTPGSVHALRVIYDARVAGSETLTFTIDGVALFGGPVAGALPAGFVATNFASSNGPATDLLGPITVQAYPVASASLTVSPASATVNVGATQVFTITSTNGSDASTVNVAVSGGGTLTAASVTLANGSGTVTFTAGQAPGGPYTLTATAAGYSSGTASATVAAPPTVVPILPANLWDNAYSAPLVYNGANYYAGSCNAKHVSSTVATSIVVDVLKTVNDTINGRIGVRINGTDAASIAVPSLGVNSVAIDLTAQIGYASGRNAVEVIAGSQSLASGSVGGTYLRSISYYGDSAPQDATPSVLPGRAVLYSDSIGTGAYALMPDATTPGFMLKGYAALLRNRRGNGGLLVEAYGSRQLSSDVTDAPSAATLAAHLAAQQVGNTGRHYYILFIGTNDYGLGGISAATFGARYALLVVAIQAADPAAIVLCISPLARVTETANAAGSTLGDFRSAIAAAAAAANCPYFDGSTILDLSLISDAGVHPTAEGHQQVYDFLAGILAAMDAAPAAGGSAAATGLTLRLGAPSGYAGQVIDYTLTLQGGMALTAPIGYTVAGLPGGSQSGTIVSGTIQTNGSFTVGAAGAVSATLTFTGGNAGMQGSGTTAAFTAQALPSGGSGSGSGSGSGAGIVLGSGAVVASPAPSMTTFSATGAGLVAPAGGYAGMNAIFQTGANATVRRAIVGHSITGTGPSAIHNFALRVSGPLPATPATGDEFEIG